MSDEATNPNPDRARFRAVRDEFVTQWGTLGGAWGNAHGNIRDLIGWGLIRSVVKKGERKEFFEAEKDVWKIFCTVVRERKRREIRPAIGLLRDCIDRTEGLDDSEAVAFTKQAKSLCEFVEMADSVLSKVSKSEQSKILPWLLKWMS